MTEALKLITQEESWRQAVNHDVVTLLRDLLAKAESGEIAGVAYACVTIDGCVSTANSKTINQSALLGGLERIKYRMLSGE